MCQFSCHEPKQGESQCDIVQLQKRKQIVLSDFALYMYVGEKVDMHFSVILNCS